MAYAKPKGGYYIVLLIVATIVASIICRYFGII